MAAGDLVFAEELFCYAKAESTFGTGVVPVATDAMRVLSFDAQHVPTWNPVNDRRGTRSPMEQVEGRSIANWSLSAVFRPSGSLGTAPDIGILMEHAMGTETVNASTSVVYTLAKAMTGKYLTVVADFDNFHQFVVGAIVQTMRIRWGGEEQVIVVDFSGQAKAYGETGNTAADGAGSSATALVVDDLDFLSQYSIISIDGDDNSGAGHHVTAVNHSTETATISSHTWSDNDVVAPFLPAPTTAGSPVAGYKGQISLDGDSTQINHVRGEIVHNTGLSLINKEHGDNEASAVTQRRRSTTFDLEFLVKEGNTNVLSEARRGVAQDLYVTLGDTAASRMKCDLANSYFNDPRVVPADEGEQSMTFSGVALGSSGEDELAITLD